MKRWMQVLAVAALVLGFGMAAAGEAKKDLTVGLVVMSKNSDYWMVVKDGAQKAVDDIGGTLIFDGPADNNDIQGQVAIMENLITSKIDAILLTPLDSDALVAPVEKAMAAGIPVVVIDSGVNTDKYVTFIATDNVSCGRVAMSKLVELIGGEGEVAIVNALAGIPSDDARGQGGEEIVKENPKVTLLTHQHLLDQAAAMAATENILIGNPNIKGVFATYNRGTLGAAGAIANRGQAGKVKLVGVDGDIDEIEYLKEGVIDALVVQQPYEMGRMGVEMAVKAINGEDVPKSVTPDVVVATRENMNDPVIHKVLYPSGE